MTYATADYDEATNTVYGYAYTEPDYAAGVYYTTAYAGAALKDADGTQLVNGSTTCYSCRAELSLVATGNGNPPFQIQSGHYVFLSYYVYNYYDPYVSQYRNGYLDYYYYTFFEGPPGGPVFNFPISFSFSGRSPATVQSSVNRFLGTLLSAILLTQTPQVHFNIATIPSDQRSFSGGIQGVDLIATSTLCNPSNNFTLTVTYDLPQYTQEVLSVTAKGFGSTSVSNWNAVSESHEDTLSTPAHGQATIRVNNKNGGQTGNPPYNAIQVTVKGRFGSGETFSETARVRINCP